MFNFLTFKYEEPIQITLFNWISLGNLNINFGILLDPLSMVVMVPIGVVTSAVLFYSLDYMRYDPARNRFYVVLSVFALFMTLLIVSDNYITMFIGWELIGVISYLLISFWNTRISAMKSALSAILLNRMGDALFVIFLGTIISLYNSVEFNTIELLTPHTHTTTLNLLAIMLLVAATAKSAQLGLHSWLLLAMESGNKIGKNNKNNIYILIRWDSIWNILFDLSPPHRGGVRTFHGVAGRFLLTLLKFYVLRTTIIIHNIIRLILHNLGLNEEELILLFKSPSLSGVNSTSPNTEGTSAKDSTSDSNHVSPADSINSTLPTRSGEEVPCVASDNKKKKGPSRYGEIWVYDIYTGTLINGGPFVSKVECSNILGFNRGTILNYLNSGELFKGKYFFSYIPLTKEQLQAKNLYKGILLETITGELLGDGHLRRDTLTARLEFTFAKDILY